MTPQEQAATLRVQKARANLIISQPFFAALALRLRLVPHMPSGPPTMGVDGIHLFFHPEFVQEQTDEHLRTIVAHEAMHCALGHCFRRETRDRDDWNIACDHAINNILKGAGFAMPESGYCDPVFAGKASEEIYTVVHGQRRQGASGGQQGASGSGNGQGQGNGKPRAGAPQKGPSSDPRDGHNFGGMGECLDAPASDGAGPASDADLERQAKDWQVATLQAAQAAKAQGNLPGNLRTLIDEIRAPKVDWRDRLRAFMRATSAANDYSWRRPNMRHIGSGDYFPSLYDEIMGPLLIGVDSSGSNAWAMPLVAAELNAILDTVKPERVDVAYCDVRVCHAETFRPEDFPVSIEPAGFGGTMLAPIWDWPQGEDNPDPCEPIAAILITDLELDVRDLGDDPGYPVLILSTGGRTAPMNGPLPWGELVEISQAERPI